MSSSSDGRDFKTDITADPSKFEAGMRAAASAAVSASDQINSQFKKIGDTVGSVNKFLMGFTAVLAGGGALKKFISDANEWNGTAGKMAAQLGVTTQQASVLNVALARLGIDSDTYTGAAEKMSKQISSNEKAFATLGVQVRDTATGAYRPITQVMAEVNTKLLEIKNPIEQNIAGTKAYGKAWSDVRPLLKLTEEQMQQSEARARQLGLIVGPEGVAMSKQYGMQMRELGLVGKSLEVQFGNSLLPVFTQLGSFMSKEGPQMGQVFAHVLQTVAAAGMTVWKVLTGVGDAIGGVAAMVAALLNGDLQAAKSIGADLVGNAKKTADEVAEIWQHAYDKPKASTMPEAPDLSKGPRYDFGKDERQSRMAAWEAQLADRKASLERQGLLEGQYRELSKADELKYWQEIKARRDLSDNERISATRKVAEVEMAQIKQTFEQRVAALHAEAAAFKSNTEERLAIEHEIQANYQVGTKEFEESQKRIIEIQRQATQQRIAIEQSRIDAQRDAKLQAIALEDQATQQALQLGLINQQQLLVRQAAFEEERYAIALQGLTTRLQLAEHDPDRNPVEVEKIHREIEQLEQQHQLRMGQIGNAKELDQLKGPLESFKTLEQGLTNMGTTMLTHWNQVGTALKSTFQQLGMSMIQELIIKPLAARVVAWAKERVLAMAGIGTDAAKAGSGAAASQASIPYVGPVLALAAMAAVFGAVMGMSGSVPSASAAGGYDIPGTINPVVQAHAREMILPAKHADVIRSLADGGGGVQAPAPAPIVLNGMRHGNFFMAHIDDLAKALEYGNRNFMFNK